MSSLNPKGALPFATHNDELKALKQAANAPSTAANSHLLGQVDWLQNDAIHVHFQGEERFEYRQRFGGSTENKDVITDRERVLMKQRRQRLTERFHVAHPHTGDRVSRKQKQQQLVQHNTQEQRQKRLTIQAAKRAVKMEQVLKRKQELAAQHEEDNRTYLLATRAEQKTQREQSVDDRRLRAFQHNWLFHLAMCSRLENAKNRILAARLENENAVKAMHLVLKTKEKWKAKLASHKKQQQPSSPDKKAVLKIENSVSRFLTLRRVQKKKQALHIIYTFMHAANVTHVGAFRAYRYQAVKLQRWWRKYRAVSHARKTISPNTF
jgi:hypothetical protein